MSSPVLLPGTERPRRGDVAHLEFLINASWIEFLTTLDDERAFRGRLVWGDHRDQLPSPTDEPQYDGICPYRGLEAFRLEDTNFFFGRENLTGWLVSALRRKVRSAHGVRFLGVLGPSGSGKSSVVLAGLLPRLTAGAIEGSERWLFSVLRPGDDPLKELAVGVTRRLIPPGSLPDSSQVLKLADDLLSADARALDVFGGKWPCMISPEDVRLVVVVDRVRGGLQLPAGKKQLPAETIRAGSGQFLRQSPECGGNTEGSGRGRPDGEVRLRQRLCALPAARRGAERSPRNGRTDVHGGVARGN